MIGMKNKPKIVFFGTPDFALPSLKRLAQDFDVIDVFCQPDRPSGRGHKLKAPPVKTLAIDLGIPVHQPQKLLPEHIKREADVFAVVAYGQKFSPELLQMPRYGCVNLHASLLPAYRGAAPVQRAIENLETKVGATIMLMDEGMDTGDMLSRLELPAKKFSAMQLLDQLAREGAELFSSSISKLILGQLRRIKQDHSAASYAKKISKEDFKYSPLLSSAKLMAKIRAFGYFKMQILERDIKIWNIEPIEAEYFNTDYKIKNKDILIKSADLPLRVLELQPANSKRMSAEAFLAGISQQGRNK